MQKVGSGMPDILLVHSSSKQHRVAKPECVPASNRVSDSYLLCCCQAVTQVIVNMEEADN